MQNDTLFSRTSSGSFLRGLRRYQPPEYFLVLALAGNLFTATRYFIFSGILNLATGAAAIRGLEQNWARAGLVALGAASYYGSMLVAAEFKRFSRPG